jgi:hypothetical protein
MRKSFFSVSLSVALASAVSPSFAAQTVPQTPTAIDAAGLSALLSGAAFMRENMLSGPAESDLHAGRARSVPHWAGSFSLAGEVFPYIMVGTKPGAGGTTRVKTTILPVSLLFDAFVDASGQRLRVDVTPDLQPVVTSPDFVPTTYGTGVTQFSDAIQRAEFWNVMAPDWHTLLEPPRVQKPLIIEVPPGVAQVSRTATGAVVTVLDPIFFHSQINTVVQLADLHPDELAIILTSNVFLSNPNPPGGLVLGVHVAFDARNPDATGPDPATARFVQTLAWASWIDPGLFSGVSDVTAISHEIAEWYNDPFVDNATERWAFPGSNGTFCQANLETGDPVEVLPNPSFPVTLHGFTYHPQTEALLQWFSQEVPSSAFDQAYSYPDTTALPAPAQNCSVDAGM